MKFSHSGINTYSTCGHSYKLKYIDKLTSVFKSSSLFFGGAIDEALNFMLLNKDSKTVLEDTISIFNTNWATNVSRYGEKTSLERNPNILYSKYDFDTDLIEKEDWVNLFAETKKYNKKTEQNIGSPLEIKNLIDTKLKTQDFEELSNDDREFYNFLNWHSLKRKGHILITGYFNQLLPEIQEVIDVQKSFELEDEDKNILNGVIDFICKLKDDRLVIADNKTSSFLYDGDSVKTSVQLSLYMKALNILNEMPESKWKHGKIKDAAYFVMSKRIEKDITKTCKSCGHISTGAHKTCDNIIDDKRCGGEWDKIKKFDVSTQLVVDTIPENVQDMVLENSDSVKTMITTGVFPKNFNSCDGKYGPCEFKALCWKNSDKNLIKRT